MIGISLVTFALLAFVVVMTPGPTVLLALSNGSRFGLGVKAVQFLTSRGTLWIDRVCGGILVLLGLVSGFLKHSEV